jgi:hypothetical protein
VAGFVSETLCATNMSIFNFFQRKPSEVSLSTSAERTAIIQEFFAARSEHNVPIRYVRHLKHSKKDIYQALSREIELLEPFARLSTEASKELNLLKSGFTWILDFQDIDPEDEALVHEINYGKRFEIFRTPEGVQKMKKYGLTESEEEDHKTFWQMLEKYLGRGAAEQGRF